MAEAKTILYYGVAVTISNRILDQVKHIITHAYCPDGVMSALILKKAFPSADVSFVKYDSPEHRNLVVREGLIFADFSPHKDRVIEFVEASAIVLDHHMTQEAVVRSFGDLGVYSDDPGVSGAVLAYEAVKDRLDESWRPLADLAGVRDTWQTRDPRWMSACEQANTLLFWPFTELLQHPEYLRDNQVGSVLYANHLRKAQDAVDNWFKATIGGVRVLLFEGTSRASDTAELAGTDFDLIVGFSYVIQEGVPKIGYSTRSHTNFDCAAFCKAQGGGGHRLAAGFRANASGDPFTQFTCILEDYLKMGER